MTRYRPNVALILEDGSGRILIGERLDVPSSWQFPQGGLQGKETPEEGLFREAEEEIGLKADDFLIQRRFGPYQYAYPVGRKKEGFDGQEQTYFLARLTGDPKKWEGSIESPEFARLRWIRPTEFQLVWVADFKREVYARVFRECWGVELPFAI